MNFHTFSDIKTIFYKDTNIIFLDKNEGEEAKYLLKVYNGRLTFAFYSKTFGLIRPYFHKSSTLQRNCEYVCKIKNKLSKAVFCETIQEKSISNKLYSFINLRYDKKTNKLQFHFNKEGNFSDFFTFRVFCSQFKGRGKKFCFSEKLLIF